MSIVLVNDFAVGDVNLTAMMETLNITYKGKSEVTLSNYDNDTAPDVKVGSVFDCNGSIFEVTSSDETPSGYSGIANDTMFYLIYSASLNEFIYTATAPAWSDSKQGWYDGNNRYFFSMYKDSGGTLYYGKKDFVNEPWYFCLTGKFIESDIYNILNTIIPVPANPYFRLIYVSGTIGEDQVFRLNRYSAQTDNFFLERIGTPAITIKSTGGDIYIVNIYPVGKPQLYNYLL